MKSFDDYSYTKIESPLKEHREEYTSEWVKYYKRFHTADGFPSPQMWMKLKGYV